MVQIRNPDGTFGGRAEEGATSWEPGPPLFDGAAAVIRSLPEVASFAMPGETVRGVTAEDGHYLVEFWPILTLAGGYEKMWELGASLLFDIDRTAKPDPKTGSVSSPWVDHFSHPVRIRMGEGGTLRNGDLHGLCYDNYDGSGLGAVCRGDASFSNDPFAAIMLLRLWVVQTLEDRAAASKSRKLTADWWGRHGTTWRQRFVTPRCIVAPCHEVGSAKVIDLEVDWIERAAKQDFKQPYPITPAEVREGKRKEVGGLVVTS